MLRFYGNVIKDIQSRRDSLNEIFLSSSFYYILHEVGWKRAFTLLIKRGFLIVDFISSDRVFALKDGYVYLHRLYYQ